MRTFVWLIPMLLTAGCRRIPTAPTEVDALLHYLWSGADDGTDAELSVGLANVYAALDGDALAERVEGSVTPITMAEAAEVGISLDPSEATGGYVARPIACTMGQIEAILSHTAQDEVYDEYEAYAREWTGSVADWRARDLDVLAWNTTYTLTALGTTYSVDTRGFMRRVSDDGGMPGIVQRAVLDAPAEIEGNDFFEQDYQLELFWDRGGDVVHLYTIWKDSRFSGFEDESEISQRTLLNSIDEWDDKTEAACESGRF